MEILCKGVALGADDGSFIEIIAIPQINGKIMELVLEISRRGPALDHLSSDQNFVYSRS